MPSLPRSARTRRLRRGLRLQARDEELLASLARFHLLTSHQLHALLFPSRTLRVAQGRLRLLFEHRLVDRVEIPVRPGATHFDRSGPVYALSKSGAALLSSRGHPVDPSAAWGLPWRGVGPATLLHHLVVSDLFVALAVAVGHDERLSLEVFPETFFRRHIERQRRDGHSPRGFIIPDGAFTLTRGCEARTFWIEVVRADIRGGTKSLLPKLRRYVELNRAGALGSRYGHERIRAVLFLTTSPARAENLRRLAATLPYGRRLFWFGAFRTPGLDGRPVSTLTPERVLSAAWQDGDGGRVQLLGEVATRGGRP